MRMPFHTYRVKIAALAKGFLPDRSANVSVIFAVAAIPILGLAGSAMDYANAVRLRSNLQNSLDMALTGAVRDEINPDDQIVLAQTLFAASKPGFGNISAPVFTHDGETLTGAVNATVSTSLLKILSIDELEVDVNSAASGTYPRGPMCFMAMHPTRKHTLESKGSVSISAPDCHIYGNSDHPYDVVDPHTAQNYITAKSVQAIGYGHHFLQNVSPPLEYAPELIADPYLNLALPLKGACKFNDLEIDDETRTLTPGTYCGGLTITDGSNVTLDPGLYVIEGGKFTIEESKLSGSGVTVYLADSGTAIEWEQAEVRLSAPTSGTYKSMVMLGVRQTVNHSMEDSTVDLHGVVYLPKGKFTWTNAGTPVINADWTVWIIDGVTWDGDGTIRINFETEGSSVPFPLSKLNVIPLMAQGKTTRLLK